MLQTTSYSKLIFNVKKLFQNIFSSIYIALNISRYLISLSNFLWANLLQSLSKEKIYWMRLLNPSLWVFTLALHALLLFWLLFYDTYIVLLYDVLSQISLRHWNILTIIVIYLFIYNNYIYTHFRRYVKLKTIMIGDGIGTLIILL